MGLERYTTEKLKSLRGLLLGIAITGILVLSFLAGVVIYDMNKGESAVMLAIIPALLFPAVLLPLLTASRIKKEINKR